MFALGCVALWLCGCSTSTPNRPREYGYTEISRSEVIHFINDVNHIKPRVIFLVSTKTYCVPTRQWIVDVFTPYFRNWLFKNNLRQYSDEEWNCVRFSQAAVTVGQMLNHHNAGKPPNTALTIGTFGYMKDVEGHCINCFIVHDENGKLELVFYEPQSQRIVQLTTEQLSEVIHWDM